MNRNYDLFFFIFICCLRAFVKLYLHPLHNAFHSVFNNANCKFLSFVVYLQ